MGPFRSLIRFPAPLTLHRLRPRLRLALDLCLPHRLRWT